MNHTQDMVMITLAISIKIFEGEILVFVKQKMYTVLNSTSAKVTNTSTNTNQS